MMTYSIKQYKLFETIINDSDKINRILNILEEYSKENISFRNYYLAAGCINQTVFNYYHNYPLDKNIDDYDIVYYDEDTSYEAEDIIIKDLYKRLEKIDSSFDIKNQKRVPIWYEEKYGVKREPYESVEDAISRWSTTVTCIGIRLVNGKLEIYAPYGLNDLFNLTIRPVKKDITKEAYYKKCDKWKSKWPNLRIIEWDNE